MNQKTSKPVHPWKSLVKDDPLYTEDFDDIQTDSLKNDTKVKKTVNTAIVINTEDEDNNSSVLFADDIVKSNIYQVQNSYHDEWEHLFGGKFYIEKLRSTGLKGQLRSCRFRSICWRVYLECLPENRDKWVYKAQLLRQQYEEILSKLYTNPRSESDDMDLSLNNPLSQAEKSPWNQYFQDSELKITIQQDVIRTFPEIEFFHTAHVQQMMINVLFCYGREFPHISYRQGMHELLAPIIFVLHSDQQAYQHASEIDLLESDTGILLNPKYTEHDAFFLFCQLMEAVEGWYLMNESCTSKYMDHFILAPFSRPPDSGPSSVLGVKLTKIYEQLLRHHDPELFSYLEQMEIAPQIYGIRWLRLLFGREFAMQDLLVIWDAIFANSLSFDLVDYIFTAMLVFIKDLLLSSDYTTCLSHLMRYPAVADVHYIIDLALHLRDPARYSKPVGYSAQMLQHVPLVGGRRDIHRAPVKNGFSQATNTVTTKPSKQGNNLISRLGNSRPKTLILPTAGNKSSSEPATLESSPISEAESCLKPISQLSSKTSEGLIHEDIQRFSRRPSDSATSVIPKGSSDLRHAGNSRTVPRRAARSFMEYGDHRLKKSGLSHSLGHLEVERNDDADALSREMVPLAPHPTVCEVNSAVEHTQRKTVKQSVKDREVELRRLQVEVSELQSMCDYCWQRMTRHLDKLQECMVHQRLQHEDEMLLALAGLKRVRDILKGTVSFSQEVTDDEDSNLVIPTQDQNKRSNNKTIDSDLASENFDGFVVVRQEMCDNSARTLECGQQSKDINKNSKDMSKCKSIDVNDAKKECITTESNNVGISLTVARRELCKFFLGSLTPDENDISTDYSES